MFKFGCKRKIMIEKKITIVKDLTTELEFKIERIIIDRLIKMKIINHSSEFYSSLIKNNLMKFDTKSVEYGILIYLNGKFILGLKNKENSFSDNLFIHSIKCYEVEPKKIFLEAVYENLFN